MVKYYYTPKPEATHKTINTVIQSCWVNTYYTLKPKATYKTSHISIYPQDKGYIRYCFDKCQYTTYKTEYLQLFIKYQNTFVLKAIHKTVNTICCYVNNSTPLRPFLHTKLEVAIKYHCTFKPKSTYNSFHFLLYKNL